jgi:glycosyltransferase involved in cell wall biosynthesis
MIPQVSVVIPLYNKGPHIARAITSVLTQTVQEFEIIVMDGNSTDEGPEIVKAHHDPRIHFFVQEGSGVSAARNQGVEKSQADFIAFLDADDEWTPHFLEIILRLKKTFPDAGLYATAYQICSKPGKLANAKNRAIPPSPYEGLLRNYFESAAFGKDDPFMTSVVAMPKEVFFRSGGFPLHETKGEDLDLFATVALHYPIAYSSSIGGIYHTDASNRVCASYYSMEEQPFVRTGKKAIAEGIVPQNMLPCYKEYIARKEIETAATNIFAGDYPVAKKILARIETRHFLPEKYLWIIISRIPKPVFDRIRITKNFLTKKI